MRKLAIILALLVAVPAVAGVTSVYMDARSPLRHEVLTYNFSATATATGTLLGVCPPGGAKLKDIVYGQGAAGVAGLRWTATPKKGGTAVVSTPGGFTLAAGANKATNVLGRPVTLTVPTGGTRPVLDAAQVSCAGGDVFTIDLTLEGVHATGTATLAEGLAYGEKVTLRGVDLVAKYLYAYNTVTCAAVQAGDTVTISDIEFAAVAGVAGAHQFSIDGTDAQDCAALAAAVTAAADSELDIVSATNTPPAATVVFQSLYPGTPGNAITLTTSTGVRLAITSAGGTLVGAYDNSACEWPIMSTLADSATALSNAITACGNAAIDTEVSATAADAVVTVIATVDGTAGNAYTWTKTGDHITVSGAGTLTGGSPYTTAVTGSVQLYLEPNF